MNIQSPNLSSSPQYFLLPGVVDLLKQSLDIYKRNLRTLLMIILFLNILFFTGIKFVLFFQSLNMSTFLKITIIYIISLIVGIFSLWSILSIIYIIKEDSEKRGFIYYYRQSYQILFSFLWLTLLSSFIILGGYFLFIIPAVVLSVWFIFAPYILVNEKLGAMDALLKSREYVKGYWWGILWRLFAFVIFIIFVSLNIVMINLIISLLFPKIYIDQNIINFINESIFLFLLPLEVIYIFLLYKSVKLIKGEFKFEPSNVQKIKFIFVGISGILIFAVIKYYFNIFLNKFL